MSASMLSTCAAHAPRTTANITLGATGSCLVVGDPLYYDYVGYVGTGTFNLAAYTGAQVVPVSEDYTGTLYQSAWLFRILQQQFTLTWEGHSLTVRFRMQDTTDALFVKNYEYVEGEPKDYVAFGEHRSVPVTPLVYHGTYTDASGTHAVSGRAYIASDYSMTLGVYVEIYLVSYNGDGFMDIAWFSTAHDVNLDEVTIVSVPAASQIVSQVVINN